MEDFPSIESLDRHLTWYCDSLFIGFYFAKHCVWSSFPTVCCFMVWLIYLAFQMSGTSFCKCFSCRLFIFSSSSPNSTVFWGQFSANSTIFVIMDCVFSHSVLWVSPAALRSCFPLAFALVPPSLGLALQWRLRPGLHHTYRRRRRVMGPLNPGCLDCFPLACPVLASFLRLSLPMLSFSDSLPKWHKVSA